MDIYFSRSSYKAQLYEMSVKQFCGRWDSLYLKCYWPDSANAISVRQYVHGADGPLQKESTTKT
jgi:hypothetical protein